MDEALLLAVMNQAVGLDTFWPTVASHASPATQLALAGTSRAARDAAVQCAPKATLILQVLPPPTPATLAVLRNSGRVLPTTVIINNNSTGEHCLLTANRIAHRLIMPQLSCPAVTTLQLAGENWLVDTALLAVIRTALPALHTLDLTNTVTPPHHPAPAAPAPAWPSLRTVCITTGGDDTDVQPASISSLLAALGIRAGGGVISLTYHIFKPSDHLVINHMLSGNQLHALRKLSLPDADLQWGADEVGGALIRNAPALEHLKLDAMLWDDDNQGTSAMCVPWRIVEVEQFSAVNCSGLPLGSKEGQPPLILRVLGNFCTGDDADGAASAQHLLSAAPGKRRVQLECTQKAYNSIDTRFDIPCTLCALTLTTTGLSNLILDGIDSEDDIKGLIDLKQVGLTITMERGIPVTVTMLRGLRPLPQVTRLGLSGRSGVWAQVDKRLLASLPEHITDVRLSGRPTSGLSSELVVEMCVHVSRLPHRQAQPLRLCVPGVTGWFDAVGRALAAAGIRPPGVVGVPHE